MKERIYFCVENACHQRVLYGPFDNNLQAYKAAFFHRSVSACDKGRKDARVYVRSGIQGWDDNEIEYGKTCFTELGLTSFRILPPTSTKIHSSWKALFREYNRGLTLQEWLDDVFNDYYRE